MSSASITFENGVTITWTPYEFGTKYGQSGGGATGHDNRLELYLGKDDTSPAELSVRHNGNNTGAKIQARNAGDTDGIFLDFTDSSHPFFRWGNAGPYLVKDGVGVLTMRNYASPSEDQQFRVASNYVDTGIKEYVYLGVGSTDRFAVRTVGSGGGTQRPLDLDGASLHFQTQGTMKWQINVSGLFQAGGSNNTFPAFKQSGATMQVRLADDSDFAPVQGKLRSHSDAVAETPTATHTLEIETASGARFKVLGVLV